MFIAQFFKVNTNGSNSLLAQKWITSIYVKLFLIYSEAVTFVIG